jgi:hypothetical protein
LTPAEFESQWLQQDAMAMAAPVETPYNGPTLWVHYNIEIMPADDAIYSLGVGEHNHPMEFMLV